MKITIAHWFHNAITKCIKLNVLQVHIQKEDRYL